MINDLISKINNNLRKSKQIKFVLRNSSVNKHLLDFLDNLKSIGFIFNYLLLKRNDKTLVFIMVSHQVSKRIVTLNSPNQRIYLNSRKIHALTRSNLSTYLISTPFGLLSSIECIRRKLGGSLMYIIK